MLFCVAVRVHQPQQNHLALRPLFTQLLNGALQLHLETRCYMKGSDTEASDDVEALHAGVDWTALSTSCARLDVLLPTTEPSATRTTSRSRRSRAAQEPEPAQSRDSRVKPCKTSWEEGIAEVTSQSAGSSV